MTKIYSHDIHGRVKAQLPDCILEALSKVGWNVFGIYEVVEKELKAEKREQQNLIKQIDVWDNEGGLVATDLPMS